MDIVCIYILLSIGIEYPVNWGFRICQLHFCRVMRPHPPSMRPPVGHGGVLIRLGDGILVAEQSLIQQLKQLSDLQYSTLALTGLNRQSKRPNLISQLVMLSPSICMIVLTIFFKLLLWKTNTEPF